MGKDMVASFLKSLLVRFAFNIPLESRLRRILHTGFGKNLPKENKALMSASMEMIPLGVNFNSLQYVTRVGFPTESSAMGMGLTLTQEVGVMTEEPSPETITILVQLSFLSGSFMMPLQKYGL